MDDLSANLDIERSPAQRLVDAARDQKRVKGLTHEFYRYPARFSPTFVRSAIETFTRPGDWVVDPFAGGGTTLVEAMAMGRNALGIDISSLSSFLCEAKTQVLDDRDVSAFACWMERIDTTINMHAPSERHDEYADAGYYRNLDGPEFWRLRKAIEQALSAAEKLHRRQAHVLARCVVLRTAQWALDSRKTRPSVKAFKSYMHKQAGLMLDAALEFREQIHGLELAHPPKAISLNRTTAGAEKEELVAQVCPPKLIVTSPPYPGIHVLYHRWQVDGRKEAPAPFWIAGKLDGAGSSYYTLGDRKNPNLQSYFDNLKATFDSVAAMAGRETTIVQMVAFSKPDWQLPKYLEVMEECGLEEHRPWDAPLEDDDGRLWRDVPSRRWHAHQKSHAPGAREVVLVHKKAGP
ncbi:DNA methyltransferase [Albidovulum sp.]|uniref:DNA methyltransferase n=1 Tax=Albidovulum sp. TaxID=1872424 RepID=UPI0025C5F9DA|nr:DNA methyltransferase [Defluviimonas sp.]